MHVRLSLFITFIVEDIIEFKKINDSSFRFQMSLDIMDDMKFHGNKLFHLCFKTVLSVEKLFTKSISIFRRC